MKQYDAIIIGFGEDGGLLAAEFANRNWKMAIIERSSQIHGGACVSVGCTPTRTLIYESEQAEWFCRDNYGSQAKFYTSAVGQKNELVSLLRNKNHECLKSYPDIMLHDGKASLMSNGTVKAVHDRKEILLQGKGIFINIGPTPILPDVEGPNESKHVLTSGALFRQNVLPRHSLILGAGTIGMEFTTIYAGLGSKVILLESGNHFMSKSGRDIAESILEALKRKSVEIQLNVHTLFMYDTTNDMVLTYTDNSDGIPYSLEGGALLSATGRRVMTDDLNLHVADVRTDTQGVIVVNGYLQTASPYIWVMENARGGAMYDYLSIDGFRIITDCLLNSKGWSMDDKFPMPYVIFANPPLAYTGATEEEAVKRGCSIQVSRLLVAVILRVRILQYIDGMLKAIVNTRTGHVMGCTLFCVDTPEAISLVALAMKDDLHYSALRGLIFTHSSMSEELNDLFKAFQHLVPGS